MEKLLAVHWLFQSWPQEVFFDEDQVPVVELPRFRPPATYQPYPYVPS